jgi:hypothetical protein
VTWGLGKRGFFKLITKKEKIMKRCLWCIYYANSIAALQQLLFSGQPPAPNAKEEGDNKKIFIAI